MEQKEIPQSIIDKANELVKTGHSIIYIDAFLLSMKGASVERVKAAIEIAINNPLNFRS